MFYLYTGRCPELCEDWASLIELSDRLCLPKLLHDIQLNCIKHLNSTMSSSAAGDVGGELTEIVLGLIDAAKVGRDLFLNCSPLRRRRISLYVRLHVQ